MLETYRIPRIPLYKKRFSNLNRLKEQEYEDRIWDCANYPKNKTKLWECVGGQKQACFKKIDEMVRTSQLKETLEKNQKSYVRIDSIKETEFELGLSFQEKMLEQSRSSIKKLKYPMFKKLGIYKTRRWSSGLRESILDTDKKGEYKPRNAIVKTNFENMAFYYEACLLFISRINLQRSLSLITKPVAERRTKKIEKILDNHFKKLQSENPRESNAIRQYFKHRIHGSMNFRI